MEKEESVGQGEKNRHAWSDKTKRLGEEENGEGGKLEPLSQGTARVGEAEPTACENRVKKQRRSSGKSGKDEGGAAESPGAPAAQRSSLAPTGGSEQRLVPVGPAPPRPRGCPRQSITDWDGTSRARRA